MQYLVDDIFKFNGRIQMLWVHLKHSNVESERMFAEVRNAPVPYLIGQIPRLIPLHRLVLLSHFFPSTIYSQRVNFFIYRRQYYKPKANHVFHNHVQ